MGPFYGNFMADWTELQINKICLDKRFWIGNNKFVVVSGIQPY